MTDDNENDYKADEIINVKLPRRQYELLKLIIQREEGYSWLGGKLKNNWLWVVGGGVLTIWLLFDKVIALFGAK